MARTVAELPSGARITDYISLGVLAKTFPMTTIEPILQNTGRTGVRQRDLPPHVVVYYVIALALYMQSSYREVLRCLLEGIQWLLNPGETIKVAGKSGISQARTRLGWKPIQKLHDEIVRPIAVESTKGAWYRTWRLVSLDGSTMDIADEKENEAVYGRPAASRGDSAFPQVRFVSLVENGTHVLFGTRMGQVATGEITLTKEVLPFLGKGMLCLADRNFFGFELWNQARATGADLIWRVKKNLRLPCETRLPDGSYLSRIYASPKDQRHRQRWSHSPSHRVYTGGSCRRRAHLSLADDGSGSRSGPGRGIGRAVSRTMGNRDGARRTQNSFAWLQNRAAQQNSRTGKTGVLWLDDGALCCSRPDARGSAESRRGSRSTVLPPRNSRGPTKDRAVRVNFPLRIGACSMKEC